MWRQMSDFILCTQAMAAFDAKHFAIGVNIEIIAINKTSIWRRFNLANHQEQRPLVEPVIGI